jgi:VWFA-related protein
MTVPRPLAAVLTVVTLLAQEPTIRTNVPLVLAPVTVYDSKGKSIDGLQPDDFILRDDGVLQPQFQMDTSDTVVVPMAIVIAIQSSGISQPALEKIHRVGGMIQPLVSGEKGQAAVLAYDTELRVLQDFTRDSDKITGAFEIIEGRTIKSAKLIDAVAKGVEMLQTRPENYRRVMLILGESRDRGSKMKLGQAIEAAQRAGVAIYPITYSAQATAWTARPEDNPPLPMDTDYMGAIKELARLGTANAADALARSTGGRHLSFARLQGLEEAISRLGEELHSQYLLSFVPAESKNKGYHVILVGVKGHPGAIIRARPGYWR